MALRRARPIARVWTAHLVLSMTCLARPSIAPRASMAPSHLGLRLSMEVRLAFEPKAVTSMQQGALTFHVAKRQKMTTVKVMGLVVSHADMVVLE